MEREAVGPAFWVLRGPLCGPGSGWRWTTPRLPASEVLYFLTCYFSFCCWPGQVCLSLLIEQCYLIVDTFTFRSLCLSGGLPSFLCISAVMMYLNDIFCRANRDTLDRYLSPWKCLKQAKLRPWKNGCYLGSLACLKRVFENSQAQICPVCLKSDLLWEPRRKILGMESRVLQVHIHMGVLVLYQLKNVRSNHWLELTQGDHQQLIPLIGRLYFICFSVTFPCHDFKSWLSLSWLNTLCGFFLPETGPLLCCRGAGLCFPEFSTDTNHCFCCPFKQASRRRDTRQN